MSKINIGVLISGGGTNLQAIIDNIKNKYINANISVVISNKKSAYGLQRARDNNIDDVFISKKQHASDLKFNRAINAELKKHDVNLVILAGFLSILVPEFIDEYENRIINIHPALIPSFCGKGYYGIKVHQAALDYGVKVSGATVHFVDKGTDTGPVILQDIVKVADNDTASTLQQKVLKIEHKLLPEAIKLYCDGKLELVKTSRQRTIVKILNLPS